MEAARAASRGVSNSGGEDGEPVGGRAGQYARCSCADNKCSDAVLTFFFISHSHLSKRPLILFWDLSPLEVHGLFSHACRVSLAFSGTVSLREEKVSVSAVRVLGAREVSPGFCTRPFGS